LYSVEVPYGCNAGAGAVSGAGAVAEGGPANIIDAGVRRERDFHLGELNSEGIAGLASPSRVKWRPSQWPQANGKPVK
jgi:hypothetical protein